MLFLDLDGVVVNFDDGVRKWYGKSFNHEKYDIDYQEDFGMTAEEFWGGLTYEFWAYLDPYPWAFALMDLLAPYKPIILTGPARSAAGGKQRWIQDHLPKIFKEGRYILSPTKWAISGPGKILIDDYEKNCNGWNSCGGKSILFPQPWNRLGDSKRAMEDRIEWVRWILDD